MEHNKMVRLIDGLGRVVLPQEMCNALDWAEKTPLEIRCSLIEGKVILERHRPTCVFCGSDKDVKGLWGKCFCPTCQKAIEKM